jgi:6-phosphofructokinase 1
MDPSEPKRRIFLSLTGDVMRFVAKVCHCLERQARVECYLYTEKHRTGNLEEQLMDEVRKSDYLVAFLTEESLRNRWQEKEISTWLGANKFWTTTTAIFNMGPVARRVPWTKLNELATDMVKDPEDIVECLRCSERVLQRFEIEYGPFDDLPTKIDASYEKEIIEHYRKEKGNAPTDRIQIGYPARWPKVVRFGRFDPEAIGNETVPNPLDEKLHGSFRAENLSILVDARQVDRTASGVAGTDFVAADLTLPEAGPREYIPRPPAELKIAILVSGGIAPGTNAVISAIVDRHEMYEKAYRVHEMGDANHRVHTFGYIEGFRALCERGDRYTILDGNEQKCALRRSVNRGGSELATARADQLLHDDPCEKQHLFRTMLQRLDNQGIDILYVIGGEGSMRAAHALWSVHQSEPRQNRLTVIGIPKTMDNDILWVWQSFGFLSAVEKARQDIIQLATEVKSNPRLGIVQLFGSSSGFVVSHAALGSNECDLALIPELRFSMVDVCRYMARRLQKRKIDENCPYGLVVMAETAIPEDFEEYINKDYVGLTDKERIALEEFKANGRRVIGQTPDKLRSASLKIVSQVLQNYIKVCMGMDRKEWNLDLKEKEKLQAGDPPYWYQYRVFTNEPRHLIRSMAPTVIDVALGIRLGTMAVDMAMAGYTDCMVSQWLTEYVAVPLKLVVLGRKRVPEGIFWRTVVTKTGQIELPELTRLYSDKSEDVAESSRERGA